MGQALSAYWWIIIPLALAFLALLFSLEKRSSKEKRAFPQNYIDGLRAIIEGDENSAFVKLKQAVADDTNNIDAYLKLGDLFRKRGQLEKAIQVHRELLIRKSLDQNAVSQIRKSLIEDFIQADKYESALEILEKLVKDSSFKIWAQEKMLEVYEKTQQWDKSFNACKNLLKSKDRQYMLAVYKHLIGYDQFNNGEYHKARLSFKDALHYDEKFATAYIMIAESYLAENRKSDAVEFFKKLASKAPTEVYRVIPKMEETLFDLGQFSDIEKVYNDILNACPDDTNILKALAGIAEKKGDLQGAINTLGPIVSAESNEIITLIRLAELYLNNDQKDKALEILKTIQEKCPSREQRYKCPHCSSEAYKQEIICPNCKRVGPYKRL